MMISWLLWYGSVSPLKREQTCRSGQILKIMSAFSAILMKNQESTNSIRDSSRTKTCIQLCSISSVCQNSPSGTLKATPDWFSNTCIDSCPYWQNLFHRQRAKWFTWRTRFLTTWNKNVRLSHKSERDTINLRLERTWLTLVMCSNLTWFFCKWETTARRSHCLPNCSAITSTSYTTMSSCNRSQSKYRKW